MESAMLRTTITQDRTQLSGKSHIAGIAEDWT